MTHHTDDKECPRCEEMLKGVHQYMQEWFRGAKEKHPTLHAACGYRGPAEQERAYREGKSRALYPKSPHNHEENNKPCSLAVDVFQIDADGVARWSWQFYALLDKENQEARLPVKWGGTFKSIKDGPHFEYIRKA